MTIDFMRKVDYWAGIPLTALLTLWIRVVDKLKAKVSYKDVKRVLFIELSEMGSAILADPALKRVGKTREIFFVIFKKNAASLGIFKTVPEKNIFKMRDDSFLTLVIDVFRFLFWCRKNQIQAVIDLETFSRFTAALSALTGAVIRIGFYNPRSEGLYRGAILTHPVGYNPHIHIAKNIVALTDPLFSSAAGESPLIKRVIGDDEILLTEVSPPKESVDRVWEAIRRRVKNISTKFFLVNVNAGDFLPQRKWPKGSFQEFIKKLIFSNAGVTVLLTGSPKERPSVDEVALNINSDRCVNIAGDLRFEDLPALYSISEGMLTNDSGPGHFASAVGLKTFVLFGPETPALYGPLRNATPIYAGLACSPCVHAFNHRNTPCTDNQCLKVINPESVFKQVHQFLISRT